MDFNGVYVSLEHETQSSVHSGIIVRRFKVWKQDISGHAKESRVIQHFQLTSWPDHGVLLEFQVIAPMLEDMNSYRCELSRALQVDARLHQALLDKSKSVEERKGSIQHAVDIPRVFHRLRSQRPGMVQTPMRTVQKLDLMLTRSDTTESEWTSESEEEIFGSATLEGESENKPLPHKKLRFSDTKLFRFPH
ncbi:hypothetical protein PsorP6_005575 [Peronosclerospora sorghi]|uniref:Uncharacterized protein n=1 Tax=Peronosclerospora sorghi TaxID=230839 RepID=A0ACC0W6M2_9STRA|nr:hypothetical protein PsorP6_005575 [Peronosclerospora sorghi]